MILLLYYIFAWPFWILGALVDRALVALGFKYYPPTGPAVWKRKRIPGPPSRF